jgi:hypothetical protein
MRRTIALGAALVVGSFGLAISAPSYDLGLPIPAITKMSEADAAGLGRGGGGASEGGGTGVLQRLSSLLQNEFTSMFFLAVAIGLAVLVGQRNAGAAVGFLVAAFVIGAFLLVPDQVESLFRSTYQFVL